MDITNLQWEISAKRTRQGKQDDTDSMSRYGLDSTGSVQWFRTD
jgi:hypothetical protein